MNTYGVANYKGAYFDVSNSERGAKNYATRHGHRDVYIRYNSGYNIELIAARLPNGKWVNDERMILRDARYTVTVEYCGQPGKKYISRFCGEFIDWSDDFRTACIICAEHKDCKIEVVK